MSKVTYTADGDAYLIPDDTPQLTPVDHDPFSDEASLNGDGSVPKEGQTIQPNPNPVDFQSTTNQALFQKAGDVLGINDALKVLRGQMSDDDQQKLAITSAMGLIPFGSELKPAAKAAEEIAPTFFSAVENALGKSPQTKAPIGQWLSFLKNQPGVKQEELDWLGLQALDNGGTVSKQDLLNHIQAGTPQVQDVMKGTTNPYPYTQANEWEAAISRAERTRNFDEADRLNQAWEQQQGVGAGAGITTTKYDKYQLPGGSNYKEMLMTMPVTNQSQKIANDFRNSLIAKYGENYHDKATTDELRKAGELWNAAGPSNIYTSSHWDEPNILAHIRMNDRTIEGNKTLHLEEIQSDWHQQGRDKGYKLNDPDGKLEDEFNKIDDKIVASNDEQVMGHPDIGTAVKMAIDRKIITPDEGAKYLRYAQSQNYNAVPDAPFKKTWADLALKRAIRYAAEHNYDAISWTPGAAQAARYDLSKHVDKVNLIPVVNPGKDGFKFRIDAFKDNNKVIEHYAKTENEISDIIGKEVAKKLLDNRNNSGAATAAGLDLSIGGEGMHEFYDRMLPAKANALAKKFGGKVETKNIVHKADDDFMDKTKNNKVSYPVSFLKITPAMRDAALKVGFPLFSAGGLMLTPTDHNPFVTPVDHTPEFE